MNGQNKRRSPSAATDNGDNPIMESTTPTVCSRSHLKPIPELSSLSGHHHHHHQHYYYGGSLLASQESFTSSKSDYSSSTISNTNTNSTAGGPQPGTYVVQVPRDQIYRVPPPENATKFKLYAQRSNAARRHSCCRTFSCLAFALLTLLAVAGVIFYVIYRPKMMSFSVDRFHVHGFNLTTSSMDPTHDVILSPLFNTTLKIRNPNHKIGIYYQAGSSVKVYHNGVNLCDAKLPSFYQAPKNVTVFETEMSGSGIVLSRLAREELLREVDRDKVPLEMDVEMPIKMKVGGVKTWRITVEVSCKIMLNELTDKAKILDSNCKTRAKPW